MEGPAVATPERPYVPVSAEELVRDVRAPQRPTIIDVRALSDHRAFHIPGAIHKGLHELAHTAALRAGEAVIVAEGHGIGRLGEVLAELRRAGQTSRLLEGGMASWCAAGGEVEGDERGRCRDADLVAPDRLFELASCPDRAVLVALPADAGPEFDAEARRLLPGRPVVRWRTPSELVIPANEAIARTGDRPLIIVDTDGTHLAALRGVLRDPLKGYAFYVRGGLAGYAAFIARHEAMNRRTTFVSQGVDDPQGRPFVAPKKECGCL